MYDDFLKALTELFYKLTHICQKRLKDFCMYLFVLSQCHSTLVIFKFCAVTRTVMLLNASIYFFHT